MPFVNNSQIYESSFKEILRGAFSDETISIVLNRDQAKILLKTLIPGSEEYTQLEGALQLPLSMVAIRAANGREYKVNTTRRGQRLIGGGNNPSTLKIEKKKTGLSKVKKAVIPLEIAIASEIKIAVKNKDTTKIRYELKRLEKVALGADDPMNIVNILLKGISFSEWMSAELRREIAKEARHFVNMIFIPESAMKKIDEAFVVLLESLLTRADDEKHTENGLCFELGCIRDALNIKLQDDYIRNKNHKKVMDLESKIKGQSQEVQSLIALGKELKSEDSAEMSSSKLIYLIGLTRLKLEKLKVSIESMKKLNLSGLTRQKLKYLVELIYREVGVEIVLSRCSLNHSIGLRRQNLKHMRDLIRSVEKLDLIKELAVKDDKEHAVADECKENAVKKLMQKYREEVAEQSRKTSVAKHKNIANKKSAPKTEQKKGSDNQQLKRLGNTYRRLARLEEKAKVRRYERKRAHSIARTAVSYCLNQFEREVYSRVLMIEYFKQTTLSYENDLLLVHEYLSRANLNWLELYAGVGLLQAVVASSKSKNLRAKAFFGGEGGSLINGLESFVGFDRTEYSSRIRQRAIEACLSLLGHDDEMIQEKIEDLLLKSYLCELNSSVRRRLENPKKPLVVIEALKKGWQRQKVDIEKSLRATLITLKILQKSLKRIAPHDKAKREKDLAEFTLKIQRDLSQLDQLGKKIGVEIPFVKKMAEIVGMESLREDIIDIEVKVSRVNSKDPQCSKTGPLDKSEKKQVDTNVQQLMGANFIGPDEWRASFGETINLGNIPSLPKSLTIEFLNGPCPFNKNKKIKDTHILFFLPSAVDKDDFTIQLFKEKLLPMTRRLNRPYAMFSGPIWFENENFYTRSKIKGGWVFMLKEYIPETLNMSYEKQKTKLQSVQGYKMPSVLERSVGEMLYYLKNNTRLSRSEFLNSQLSTDDNSDLFMKGRGYSIMTCDEIDSNPRVRVALSPFGVFGSGGIHFCASPIKGEIAPGVALGAVKVMKGSALYKSRSTTLSLEFPPLRDCFSTSFS